MCVNYILIITTAHQFMYNRGNDDQKRNLFGNYMEGRFGSVEEEDEQSEEEDHLAHSHDYRRPQLDPISQGMGVLIANEDHRFVHFALKWY